MTDLVEEFKNLQGSSKTNLTQKAYQQIKEAILFAKFKPGEFLSTNSLATILDMSRTPIREALKELAKEGLVEMQPGKEAVVKDISEKDLIEIYELRELLECKAVETAVKYITLDEINNYKKTWVHLYQKIESQEGKPNWEELAKKDNELHYFIISKSENNRLKEFMKNLSQHHLRYQLLAAKSIGNPKETVEQHVKIIEAFENVIKENPGLTEKDYYADRQARIEGLKELMGSHILAAREAAQRIL